MAEPPLNLPPLNLQQRLASANINEEELASLLWPYLAKETYAVLADHEQDLKRQSAAIEARLRVLQAEQTKLRNQLLCAAISGLTAAWSYEDRKQVASASQTAATALRIVDAVMHSLEMHHVAQAAPHV